MKEFIRVMLLHGIKVQIVVCALSLLIFFSLFYIYFSSFLKKKTIMFLMLPLSSSCHNPLKKKRHLSLWKRHKTFCGRRTQLKKFNESVCVLTQKREKKKHELCYFGYCLSSHRFGFSLSTNSRV